MVHVDMVIDSLRATGDLGFGTLMVHILHGWQAGAGSRRRHRHGAKTGVIDARAGSARMRAGGIGARGVAYRLLIGARSMADGLLTRFAAVEFAVGVFARYLRTVADGRVGGCRAVEDAVSHEDLLEVLIFAAESVDGLDGVVVGHLGADQLFFDGANVDFFALAMGAGFTISMFGYSKLSVNSQVRWGISNQKSYRCA